MCLVLGTLRSFRIELKLVILTSGVGDFINEEVIEKEFVTACRLNGGRAGDNHNHQDVREGGESPPLPRNCERSLETGDQPENHWSQRAPGRWLDKVAERRCGRWRS